MIDFQFSKNCYGCRNCENICPKKAISIIEDENGFLIPIVDKDKCVNCGLCEKKCPRLAFIEKNDKIFEKEWYGAFNINSKDLKNSTSGAIFPVIASEFLENGDYVCGCVWNKEMSAEHILSNDTKEVKKMCGSKYVQSNLGEVLIECKKVLNEKKILFTGTPCQIAAAKLYLGDNDNILYLGLICEGVGPDKVWKSYLREIEKKHKSKIINAELRNKDICWDSPVAKYHFENKKIKKHLSFSYDTYMQGFLSGIYNRESCYNCQYKGNNHNSDIIIGDLWGCPNIIRKDSKQNGASLVIINTEKGKKYLSKIEQNLKLYKIEKNIMSSENPSLMSSSEMPKERNEFYKKIKNEGFSKSIKIITKKNKKIFLIKNLLYKIKLFKIIKKIKYTIKPGE